MPPIVAGDLLYLSLHYCFSLSAYLNVQTPAHADATKSRSMKYLPGKPYTASDAKMCHNERQEHIDWYSKQNSLHCWVKHSSGGHECRFATQLLLGVQHAKGLLQRGKSTIGLRKLHDSTERQRSSDTVDQTLSTSNVLLRLDVYIKFNQFIKQAHRSSRNSRQPPQPAHGIWSFLVPGASVDQTA
jgi:hypothetical protein